MQGLGIAAFTLSIIAIFTPFFGVALSGIAGLMAMACYRSKSVYAVASVVMNLVNLLLFSPVFFLAVFGELTSDGPAEALADRLGAPSIAGVFFFLLGIQLIAIGLFIYSHRVGAEKVDKKLAGESKERIEPTLD